MPTRKPIVAGSFYPGSSGGCSRQMEECLAGGTAAAAAPPERAIGAIVPHAGWVCSGAVAAATLSAIRQTRQPATFVLFGAVHVISDSVAAMYHEGAWETPIGQMEIDSQLADAVLAAGSLVEADPRPHDREHSLEVQLPFIHKLFGAARILPIMVRPSRQAAEVGRQVARAVQAANADVVYLGSTDLTHYGPRYGFTPEGVGREGVRWAKQVNDRRVIDLICTLEEDHIVEETNRHQNACGGGAIAGTVAACRASGAKEGRLLWHTSSSEVLGASHGEMEDSVGYAGIILV